MGNVKHHLSLHSVLCWNTTARDQARESGNQGQRKYKISPHLGRAVLVVSEKKKKEKADHLPWCQFYKVHNELKITLASNTGRGCNLTSEIEKCFEEIRDIKATVLLC